MNAWLTFDPIEGWELWFKQKPRWEANLGGWCNSGSDWVPLGDEAPEGWRGETYTRHRIWPVTVRLV